MNATQVEENKKQKEEPGRDPQAPELAHPLPNPTLLSRVPTYASAVRTATAVAAACCSKRAVLESRVVADRQGP